MEGVTNMTINAREAMSLVLLSALMAAVSCAEAATQHLGGGFRNHGVATPVSNHRGTVATVDGDGKDVVLSWLFDHTGCYALLAVEADTGVAVEYPMPFPSGGDCPYASILSSKNKYYTHLNSHFVQFDPAKREFVYQQALRPTLGGTAGGQGPRIFINGPDGIYVLFGKGIAKLNTETHELTLVAESPVPIASGGDYLDGRIYFTSGSSVYSYELPK